MTVGERSFLDTNILVYAATPAAPQHTSCRELLASNVRLCASAQVFAEFYAAVTHPRRVTVPFTPSEAETFLAGVLPRFELLPIPAAVVLRWARWAAQHDVTGHAIFDLQLIATMLENDVRRIYTYNRQDFEPFAEWIEVLTP